MENVVCVVSPLCYLMQVEPAALYKDNRALFAEGDITCLI